MLPYEQRAESHLVRSSTSTRVYDILRRLILTRELKPGTRLVEAKIAKDMNVSITPVRQAFSLLSSQGLLTVFPYKGTYVTILTKEYANDVIAVRKVLEPMAFGLAFDRLKPSDANYLKMQCEMADIGNSNGDILASIEHDVLFHEFFFDKSDNAMLIEIWNILKNRIAFFQTCSRIRVQAKVPRLITRHGAIIDAVRNMDKEALLTSIVDHLDITLAWGGLPPAKKVNYK